MKETREFSEIQQQSLKLQSIAYNKLGNRKQIF